MSELERFEASIVTRDDAEPDASPEFVIVGVRRPGGGVTLFVSGDVIETKFARRIAGYDEVPVKPGGPVAHVPRVHAIVGAEMASFEQVLGDDYLGALRTVIAEQERKRRGLAG